jgi:hypothetical protein
MSVFHDNYDGTMSEAYAGCVLGTGSKSYHDDSDSYAIVWDEQSQSVTTAMYATTRCAADGHAVVDAAPEVIAKAKAWLKGWAAAALDEGYINQAYKDRATIEKGTEIRVWKGRKVPIGTTGTVFWKGQVHYGTGYHHKAVDHFGPRTSGGQTVTRVGFNDAQGTTWWTSIENVEKADRRMNLPSDDEIQARAQAIADERLFYLPFVQFQHAHDAAIQAVQRVQAVA